MGSSRRCHRRCEGGRWRPGCTTTPATLVEAHGQEEFREQEFRKDEFGEEELGQQEHDEEAGVIVVPVVTETGSPVAP